MSFNFICNNNSVTKVYYMVCLKCNYLIIRLRPTVYNYSVISMYGHFKIVFNVLLCNNYSKQYYVIISVYNF